MQVSAKWEGGSGRALPPCAAVRTAAAVFFDPGAAHIRSCVWLRPMTHIFRSITAVLLISLVWPTVGLPSYVKWRVPALAFLQLFLFALPFNFDTGVFNALAPSPGTGALGPVVNVFQLAMSEQRRPPLAEKGGKVVTF